MRRRAHRSRKAHQNQARRNPKADPFRRERSKRRRRDGGGLPVEFRAQLIDDGDRLLQRPARFVPQFLGGAGLIEPRLDHGCALLEAVDDVTQPGAGA